MKYLKGFFYCLIFALLPVPGLKGGDSADLDKRFSGKTVRDLCPDGNYTPLNPGFETQLIFDKNTGRVTIFMLYTGEKPVQITATGKELYPEDLIAAHIRDYDNRLKKLKGTEFAPYNDPDYSVSPSTVKRLRARELGAGRPPDPDETYTLKKGEIIGSSCYIWELEIWEGLGKLLRKHNNENFILSAIVGGNKNPDYESFEIDLKLYDKMEELRLKHLAWQKKIRDENSNMARKEREKRAKEKKEKGTAAAGEEKPSEAGKWQGYPKLLLTDNDYYTFEDQSVCIQLDEKSGRLISYFLYNGPIFRKGDEKSKNFMDDYAEYRDLDIDDLYGVMELPVSGEALVCDYNTNPAYRATDEAHEELIKWGELYGKTWDERDGKPLPKSPYDRKLTLTNDVYIFGSYCHIWELELWQELGERIKKYKKPYCLMSPGASSNFLRHDCLPGYSIKVDEALYNRMEALRKAEEEKKAAAK